MKKIFAIIFCLATWQVATAQDASFGIKVGLATNSVNLEVENQVTADGTNYQISAGDTKVGFLAGFMGRVSFGGLLLMPELYFSSTTNNYELSTGGVSAAVQDADQTLVKLDIPVLVGYKFGPMRVNAGPVGTFILSEENGIAGVLLGANAANVDEGTKGFTFGFQAGIGIDISKLAIDLRYEGNLSQLAEGLTVGGTEYQFDSRQRQIMLSVGVLF